LPAEFSILKLQCTKFDLGWGLQRSPRSLRISGRPTSKRGERGKTKKEGIV